MWPPCLVGPREATIHKGRAEVIGMCGWYVRERPSGAFQVEVGQLRARVRVPGSCGVRGAAPGPLYGNAFAVASYLKVAHPSSRVDAEAGLRSCFTQ